jgi:hypothetical protein
MSSIMRRRSGLISVIVISCSKVGLKQPNPSNQKRIMQIPRSKCRASGFVQSSVNLLW